MGDIKLNFDKDVMDRNDGMLDGDQTGMSIMDQQMTFHQGGCYIINTTRTVRDITQDTHFYLQWTYRTTTRRMFDMMMIMMYN